MEWTLRIAAIRRPSGFTLAIVAIAVAALPGCSRRHYHVQADKDVYHLVAQKSDDPRWSLPGFDVEMDPRSRYYEPYNEDKPPLPADDPASHRLMHVVDGKHGYPHWHRYGNRPELENPCWREQLFSALGTTPEGRIPLSIESAMNVARLHSPDYQDQLEDIFLSALDVSTERFRFDVQFLQSFSGNDTTFTHLGRRRAGGESNTLGTDTDLRLQRRFATAGELLVGFANSTVWQFAGPNTHSTTSILNFSLVQPLLRAGGRVVALEQLTIVERTLLANLRAFQRYRQGFYTELAVGDDSGVVGPQRRGGFFGGTGLTGFTGQGAGGLGGVGQATGFGRGGFGAAGGGGGAATGFAGGGAGRVGGYIGLLQGLQEIRNTKDSLNAELRTLDLLEAYREAGVIGVEQVDQFRQNIETERANLLQAEVSLDDTFDAFKSQTLGLPPDGEFELDDSLILQFQFLDPEFPRLQGRINDLQSYLGGLPDKPQVETLQKAMREGKALVQAVEETLNKVNGDLEKWEKQVEQQQTDERLRRELIIQKNIFKDASKNLAKSEKTLDDLQNGLKKTNNSEQTYDGLIKWTRELLEVADDFSLVQARARVETIPAVEPIGLTSRQALVIARGNRLDWMNNRAALVDTWRLIEFNANALQSNVDIVFSGDIQTLNNRPFRFRGPTGSLQVGLQFDGPFNRLLERNNYRQSLIDYQRDRRQLIQFEDGVHRTLRSTLRRLEQLRANLEIQRRAVAIAIRRVDQTRKQLDEPPPALPLPGQTPQFSPTAALNLLTALSDLRSTQNNFMSVWLNFYATRMVLYRELGVMELDDRGNWIDRPLCLCDSDAIERLPLPPDVSGSWLEDAGLGPPRNIPSMPPAIKDSGSLPSAIPVTHSALNAPPVFRMQHEEISRRNGSEPRMSVQPASRSNVAASLPTTNPLPTGWPTILRPPAAAVTGQRKN